MFGMENDVALGLCSSLASPAFGDQVALPRQKHRHLELVIFRFLTPGIYSMAGKAQTTTKRLLHELRSYEQEPSEALLHLGPVNDDELMHWSAVMKGVSGTAYEG